MLWLWQVFKYLSAPYPWQLRKKSLQNWMTSNLKIRGLSIFLPASPTTQLNYLSFILLFKQFVEKYLMESCAAGSCWGLPSFFDGHRPCAVPLPLVVSGTWLLSFSVASSSVSQCLTSWFPRTQFRGFLVPDSSLFCYSVPRFLGVRYHGFLVLAPRFPGARFLCFQVPNSTLSQCPVP